MPQTRLPTFSFFSFLAVFLLVSFSVPAQELKAVYAQDYLPFSWETKHAGAQGVEIDFVKVILSDKLGIKVNHAIFPWARAQAMVEEGQADMFVTIPNETRRTYSLVSQLPLFSSQFLMHTGSSNPKKHRLMAITSLQELISQKDILHGHIVGAGWHALKLKGVELLQVAPSSLQILQLLDKNRIDVYIEQASLIRYQIKTLGFERRITEIPNVLEETHWHICMGKQSSFISLMPAINKLLHEMNESGELAIIRKEIFSQYQ